MLHAVDSIKKLLIANLILEDKEKFEMSSFEVALSRVRLICLGIVIFSSYFFYADLMLFKNASDLTFKTTLIGIHLIGFVFSILFLILYTRIKSNFNISFVKLLIRAFICVALFASSLASINSQRLTGNIDAYIVVVLMVSFAFPFEPIFMFFSLLINHTFFILGITLLSKNSYVLISKQINATAMLAAGLLFCLSLYRYRTVDFMNKQKLIKSESNFRKLFSVNPLPLLISRCKDGRIIMANERAYEFYGYDEIEFYNTFAVDLYKDPAERNILLNRLEESMQVRDFIAEQKCKSGIIKWVIANCESVNYEGEDCILTSVTDITELKKMENELQSHASIDSLTGILNRRTGIELLKKKIEISKQNNSSLIICFIDIDELKMVNDKYGHNEGDFLISTICSIVKDTLGSTDIIFRYGGDEFVILFPDRNHDYAEDMWLKIKTKLNQLNAEALRPYNISASHGLFEFNNNTNRTLEEILDLADKQMYLEKSHHKNRRL